MSEAKSGGIVGRIKAWYASLEECSPQLAKTLYQVFFFVAFSLSITIIQFVILMFLPSWLGLELAGTEFMWPEGIEFDLLGSHVRWCLVGAEVLRDASGAVIIGGGLGAAIANWVAPFVAQCINFPLQRNITFKSHGNVVYQAFWYFIAWVLISLVTGGITNAFKPVIVDNLGLGVYSLVQTILIGGVSMIVMFFVFKIIFPEEQPA